MELYNSAAEPLAKKPKKGRPTPSGPDADLFYQGQPWLDQGDSPNAEEELDQDWSTDVPSVERGGVSLLNPLKRCTWGWRQGGEPPPAAVRCMTDFWGVYQGMRWKPKLMAK